MPVWYNVGKVSYSQTGNSRQHIAAYGLCMLDT